MKLKLFARKLKFGRKNVVRLAVIDIDRSSRYPQNFVCMLPQYASKLNPKSPFFRVFQGKSRDAAESLLIEALKEDNDEEIKAEINRRLKQLKA